MWKSVALLLTAVCAGCAAEQPEKNRYVAAVEISLKSAADRAELIAILRRHAAADEDLHVDDVSDRWRKFEAETKTSPGERGTIFVGVWRGANDDDLEVDVSDSGHPGRAWVTFLKGPIPTRSTALREAVLTDIDHRWPDAQPLPILPTGGLPLVHDLRMTKTGYKIAASSAATYELDTSSPLVAHE